LWHAAGLMVPVVWFEGCPPGSFLVIPEQSCYVAFAAMTLQSRQQPTSTMETVVLTLCPSHCCSAYHMLATHESAAPLQPLCTALLLQQWTGLSLQQRCSVTHVLTVCAA
jgi:hypothetical protein